MSVEDCEIHKFIRQLREEFELGPTRCDFYGWKPFDEMTDEIVREAPEILGHLVALDKDLRTKAFREGWSQSLMDCCGEVYGRINSEIAEATRDRPELELRHTGVFVFVKATRVDTRKFERREPVP